jgi:membrane protein implicated in regulation of membrane protease activity
MTQSRRLSLIEAATNVVVGYGLAVVTQIVAFPWFGLIASIGESLTLGALFTGISLIRSYLLRRLFDRMSHRRKRTSRSWS